MLCGRYFTNSAVSLHPRPQVLVTVLQLPRDTLTKATTVEKTFRWVLAYSLSGLVHYHHSGEHGGRCAAGEVGVLEPQSLPPSDTLPLTPVSPSKPVRVPFPRGEAFK